MTPERWQRIEALFDDALALPPKERNRFLDDQCGPDETLRREVAGMLSSDAREDPVHRIVEQVATNLVETRDSWEGRRLGPYRILRTIGKGGMGAVFLAVRDDDQYRKEVAIKTLKFEASDSFALNRFRHERQVLASLEHPNIARLLDGGTSEQGMPYLVMEYVAGVPITEFCAGKELSIDARVRLFLHVCDAVQYAHQMLVVHRDIKPGNILVTADGVPKLLDFGIAKLLDPGAEGMPQTSTGWLPMTPDYASPEQLLGQPVSAASDVYSLGIVLYELLAGKRPYETRPLPPPEVHRVICEVEPARLNISEDLDNILSMALRKEAERRYRSVRQLAEDIERALTHRPVLARADTIAYRVRKFARRNWYSLTAGALLLITLSGGIVVSQYQARRAERRFQDVRGLANSFIFDVNRRLQDLPGTIAAREAIVSTSLTYLERLAAEAAGDPSIRAELTAAYQAVGDIQIESLGRIEDARRTYVKTIELGERLLGERNAPPVAASATAAAYMGLMRCYRLLADPDRALESGHKALALAESAGPRNGWSRQFLVTAYRRMAGEYLESFLPVQGLDLARKGLALLEDAGLSGEELRFNQAVLHWTIASALKDRGDLTGALAESDRGREIFLSLSHREDPRYLYDAIIPLMGPVGGSGAGPLELFHRLGTPASRKQAYDLLHRVAARDTGSRAVGLQVSTDFARALDLLAQDRDAAYDLFRDAIRTGEQQMAAEPQGTSARGVVSNAEALFGEALYGNGRLSEALTHLKRALELAESLTLGGPTDRRRLMDALIRLGRVETRMRLLPPARDHLERCLQLALSLWPRGREDLRSFAYIGMSYEALGDLEKMSGNQPASCEAYRKSAETWRTWPTVGVSSFYDQEHVATVQAKVAPCRR